MVDDMGHTAYTEQDIIEMQQVLLETLAPKNRVEELEDEVSFLKSLIRMHSEQIAELKKKIGA